MSYDLSENKRESVLLAIVNNIKGIEDDMETIVDGEPVIEKVKVIKTVKRTVPSVKEYIAMPTSICPCVCIVGKLPFPIEDSLISCANEIMACQLDVEIWFFGVDKNTPCSAISYYYQRIWRSLYSNPKLNGLVEGILLVPEPDINIVTPNYAFLINLKTTITLPAGEI